MNHNRVALAAAFAIAALATQDAVAARLEYTLDLGVGRNDNLNFSPDDPREDTIYRPGVGFSLTEDSEKVHASVAGRVEYRHYADGTYDNGVDGEVSGRVDWHAIPNRLTFTVEDTLGLEAIDTLEADSPDNRQQVNVFSAGPNLAFRVGAAMDGEVELRYVDTEAEVTDEFNSSRIDLAVRTTRRLDAASNLAFNLRVQSVDFDNEITGRNYQRADLYGRYERHLRRFDLGLDAGYSTINYKRGSGDRSEPLLRGDVTWIPSDAHRFRLGVAQQFSDAATDAMEQLDDGVVAPGSILTGDTVINASPFKERRATFDYTYTSTRYSAAMESYAHRLDYVDSDEFDQTGRGVRATLLWVLNSRLVAGAFAGIDTVRYSQLEREDKFHRYGLNLSRTFTSHWSGRLELSRIERETRPGPDAQQNSLFLVIRYTR